MVSSWSSGSSDSCKGGGRRKATLWTSVERRGGQAETRGGNQMDRPLPAGQHVVAPGTR